ncbi:putative nuclease HARBI1 [Belonocnema kinseyi]|uniref:putative nuclease HARBI1 n=1 Tax=Belonocnema kinseyi TaxID=2817044 RepID=UPI00143CC1B6|nr:putative nuclease HARBI1 [Belonocnema kinseyi]
MPTTQQERTAAQVDFYGIARFPRVTSALDCTHVKVQSFGGNDAEVFRNRKGFFSINVQAACDAQLKFTNIVARWPVASHDSTIFRNFRLHARLKAGEFTDGLILGDGGYALKPYLITPIQNPNTKAEILFDESQIRTRSTIERKFGVWKRRFPCLGTEMRFSVNHVLPVIVATAVLHNKARMAAEPMPPDDLLLNIEWNILLNEDLQNRGNVEPDAGGTRALLLHYFQR